MNDLTFYKAPLCSVGAVYVWEQKLLLIRRAKQPAMGYWSIPGGHVEPGESWHQAVEREVKEETALESTCGGFIGWVERKGNGERYLIADFEIAVTDPSNAHPGDDASALIFASQSDMDDLEITPGLLSFLRLHEVLSV